MKDETAPIRAGMNATVTRTPGGFAVSLGRPPRWEHPWATRLHWLGDLGQWVATVRPGFVNGVAPIVRTTAGKALALAGKGTFYQGLINARSSVADIRRAAELAREETEPLRAVGPGTRLDVALYNNPPVPLGFRALGLGSGGGVGSAVPQFFKDKGVREAPRRSAAGEDAPRTSDDGRRRGHRLLRACDVVLHQPRLALTSSVSIEPGISTGFSNVTQTLGLRGAVPGDRLKVFATPLWNDNYAATAGINPLAGDYEEPAFDELRIATAYLLSPPDAEPGSAPDHTWQPWVRHSLFWNLSYQRAEFHVLESDPGLPFIPPLAGGAAQLVINFLTASINDMTRQALNILEAHSMAGAWWTATGGGSASEFPPEPEPEPRGATGFDRAGRLQAKRTAVARALKAARLDPPFPFRAMPFDPSLFS